MGTAVYVNTQVFTSTHVAANLVRSLKQIVTDCGLDPSPLIGQWRSVEEGVATWIRAGHLKRLVLEVYSPETDVLIKRFDFDIDYGYHLRGDGDLWIDSDAVGYAVRKAGLVPSECSYRIVAVTSEGAPSVDGWGACLLRSTDGLRRRSIGATVGGGSLGASLTYWS